MFNFSAVNFVAVQNLIGTQFSTKYKQISTKYGNISQNRMWKWSDWNCGNERLLFIRTQTETVQAVYLEGQSALSNFFIILAEIQLPFTDQGEIPTCICNHFHRLDVYSLHLPGYMLFFPNPLLQN